MKAQESLNPALSPEIISTLTSLHPRSRILASFQKFQMSIFIGKTGSGEIICFSKASFILDLPRRPPLQRTAGEHSHSVEEFCPTDSPGGQHDRWRCLETPTSPMQHGEHSPSGAGYRYHKGDRREMLFLFLLIVSFYSKYSRRLPRQMTVSGDSGYSYSSRHYRSATKLFGRALSRTLTINSMDGSNSTILLEDWRFALPL